jgi:opacity protein-like surface antigen
MKTITKQLAFTAIFTTSLLAALNAAQGQSTSFYVRGDVGGAVTRDTELKEFFGEPLAPGSTVKFHPGFRFGLTAGYQLTDWFAAEFQTGVMANSIDSITGASRVKDASLSNVPLLVNARFQLPNRTGLVPFIGGGGGGASSVLSADHIDLGATKMHGTDSSAVFAWQAFAGLRYEINSRMSVSLEYHYFATTAPDWKAETTFGTTTDRLRLGGIETHAATVAFEFKF